MQEICSSSFGKLFFYHEWVERRKDACENTGRAFANAVLNTARAELLKTGAPTPKDPATLLAYGQRFRTKLAGTGQTATNDTDELYDEIGLPQ